MCGIYGKIRFDGLPADARDAERACASLAHRGPDDRGVCLRGGACLGHTRLSIIDLSPAGRQPMRDEGGSRWIVFNGEIYNFRRLKEELEGRGRVFRTRSDTEVILHLFDEYGPECVHRLRGMFAFGIWDEADRALFLARDRVGKKPLYYHLGPDVFAFASELAPLAEDPEIPLGADPVAIHHYLTYQSVPAPLTAFRGISKLPPGHWMTVRAGRTELRRYWTLRFTPKHAAETRRQAADLEERLLGILEESVRLRMVSDVPVGALLSGGVDSSGIVALMARVCDGQAVRTFTAGFEEAEYDESERAREVARFLGTDHREGIVRADAAEALPVLVERFGEPFADSSAIPTYFVTKAARERVKVALCGDGGDESFAGYDRYRLNALLARLRFLPSGVPRKVFRMLRGLPMGGGVRSPLWIVKRLTQAVPLDPVVRNIRFYGNFDNETKGWLYAGGFAAATAGIDSDELVLARFRETDADNLLDATLYADIHTYLPDTLLPKADRASMANSLELRSPLLDHEVMEFAARLPAELKLRRASAKYLLKRAFGKLLPARVLSRPKRGFGVPLDRWFRGPLRDTVRDALLSRRALERGYFREESIRRILAEHESRRWHWHHQIYNLLMLELWHRRFLDR